jgi:exonuclease SbcC
VDLVAIAGDVWDASMLNTEGSGFTRFVEAIRDIANLAPVAVVYGTPSHDTDGSLEIFRNITCKYGITILEPGQAYFLKGGFLDEEPAINAEAVLFGIPEPRKKYLLAETSLGKDETEEAIRSAMHKMCFLLAAKRKEYPSMPCIVLYHGDVSGCVLQNDQAVERGTGIAITADDLNDIDADYYALGHIHKPQRVGNLPAYYAGSIYPKNFGENHQAGFNVVTLTQAGSYGWNADVERVDFPQPQNLKIESAYPILRSQIDGFEGKRIWVEITCTREQRSQIDLEAELADLMCYGAVPGSRVTINDLPVETVRAAEITEVNTPAKKFEIWAENSNVKYEASLIKKIESLETEITMGTVRAAGEWELVSIRLRGAIGIKKGIHKDEIAINFDNYADGLVALTGANGRGKTTLIENCHPYPQLLTRGGKLQDHFCLRDSLREVIYRNRAEGGKMVKFLIQIDGQSKSGSCKYFVFDASPSLISDDWIPRPGVDGNLKPYEDALAGIFGPMELYLRTAFITQRPTKKIPDLTDATAGEKKALFVELAGIDYLQRFADSAADKSKEEAAKNHDAEIKVKMLENTVSRKAAEEQGLKVSEETLIKAKVELSDVTEQGKAAKAEVDRLQAAFNTEQARQEKENEARRVVDKAKAEIDALNADKDRYHEFAKNRGDYDKEIAEYESLQKTVEAENAKKQKFLEVKSAKQQEYTKNLSDHNQKVKIIEIERDNLCDRRNGVERLVLTGENNIKLYERDAAEIKENCPACGQRLPPEKLSEMKARRDQFIAKIDKEKEEIQKQSSKLEEINKQIEGLTEQIAELSFDEPLPVNLAEFNDSTLRTAMARMNQINIAQSRAALAKAQEAAVRIEGIEKQVDEKLKFLEEKQNEVSRLIAGIEEGTLSRLSKELNAAVSIHAGLTERYTAVKSEIARQEAIIEAAHRTLAEIEAQEKELATLRKQIFDSVCEGGDWDLIAKAFGKDGIQALELDALAPGISDTANRILESAYGDRFKIAIETTRIGGAGKKTKQIEDFLIYVTDAEDGDGEPALLENKSGGEAVWIKRAIYDAFAVIRKRNTNFAFLSCFQDETDGALDSAAKTAYARMLEAAHAESKLRHTFVITHSNEVKAMIDQKIDMEELAVAG